MKIKQTIICLFSVVLIYSCSKEEPLAKTDSKNNSTEKIPEEEIDIDFSNLDLSGMNLGREIILLEDYESSTKTQITNAIEEFYIELDDLKADKKGEYDIVYMGVYKNTLRVSAVGIYKDNKGSPVFTFLDPIHKPLIGGPAPQSFGMDSCPGEKSEIVSCKGTSCVEEGIKSYLQDNINSSGDCATITVKRSAFNAVVCSSSANCG